MLVGPSGCGKSTLLRMLAGLEEITGGTIAIDGKVVNDVESKDRDIAMVFQSYALYPHMTVSENMAFSLKLRRADAKVTAERVAHTAKILNLDPYLGRYPRELSGGQRQRVHYGIRPGDIAIVAPGEGIAATVVVVEPTGAETELLIQAGQAQVIMITHGRPAVNPGERVGLAVTPGKVHVFDQGTGARIAS